MDITSFLHSIGFTDGEARAYKALIRTGPTTVGPILNETHISQSKIYGILERLIQKGAVTYVHSEGHKMFSACDPSALNDFLEKKETELIRQKKMLESMIPDIRASMKTGPHYEVSVFEGFKGFKAAYMELFEALDENGEYVFFAVHGVEKDEKLSLFFRQFHMRREKKRFSVRGISYRSSKFMMEKIFKNLSGWQMRYTEIPLPFNTTIYKDTILLLNWSEGKPAIFKIKCKSIADDYMRFFESVWRKSRR